MASSSPPPRSLLLPKPMRQLLPVVAHRGPTMPDPKDALCLIFSRSSNGSPPLSPVSSSSLGLSSAWPLEFDKRRSSNERLGLLVAEREGLWGRTGEMRVAEDTDGEIGAEAVAMLANEAE